MMAECADVTIFSARLRIYPHNNVSEKRVLFATQLFDPAERDALKALAAPGAVFLDIGANVGLYSISVGEAFAAHSETRIVAVEPHPYIYRRLAFNAGLNPAYNITAVEAGIADHEGTLSLTLHGDNLGETRMVQDGMTASADAIATEKVVDVPVVSLMQLVATQELERIDGMKVDVEGFEEKVMLPFFDAAPDALLPRVIIIENNVRHWDVDIVAVAAKRGYTSHRISKNNLLLSRDSS
jgi:FkbM family methyltransferase